MTRFIGRRQELEGLKGLLKKNSASLVVIKGRRRIGKSRLAEEFTTAFPKSYFLTGLPPEKGVTDQDQRNEFARQLKRSGITVTATSDWGDLLTDLALVCAKGHILIVLDEITWMGDLDPTFLPKLKTIWDTLFKKNSALILLISGSNSPWIDKNILGSTGFVGRISYQLHLTELPLYRCNEFWQDPHGHITAYEKFKILAVTGGVPRYLEEIRMDLSAEQNLYSLCYRPTGILFHEFEQIFSDLFVRRNRSYKEIISQVANHRLSMGEIADRLEMSNGGDFSQLLNNLVEAGFLSRDSGWDIGKEREERLGHYRLSDNYVRFYLKYIEPYKNRIQTGKINALPRGWLSIMGLQFENLVCNNGAALFHILGLSADEVVWSGPHQQMGTTRQRGCQIDYLIQTKHRVLYLCEVKFSENEVPYSVVNDVLAKAKNLKIPRGFSLRCVLIHVNGVAEKLKYDETFSNIIDFGQFLTVEF
jgi:AAA+ ATPase superfamily predicted ATPase